MLITRFVPDFASWTQYVDPEDYQRELREQQEESPPDGSDDDLPGGTEWQQRAAGLFWLNLSDRMLDGYYRNMRSESIDWVRNRFATSGRNLTDSDWAKLDRYENRIHSNRLGKISSWTKKDARKRR